MSKQHLYFQLYREAEGRQGSMKKGILEEDFPSAASEKKYASHTNKEDNKQVYYLK